MTPATFARLVHELARVAVADGANGSELLKSALVGTFAAVDPDDRISAASVAFTTRVRPGEIKIDVTSDDRDAHRVGRVLAATEK